MIVETPKSPVVQAVQLVVVVTALMWVLEAVDALVFSHGLDQHGIIPRSWGGLAGIIWAPWLHGSFGHLLANTLPFLLLGSVVALDGIRRWLSVTAFVVLVGGAATWLLARPAVHIGSSGLIFGYVGFLLVAGFVEKSLKGVTAAVLVGLLFGGMVLEGIVPVSSWVSWESHVFGLSAGVLSAFVIATPASERTARESMG